MFVWKKWRGGAPIPLFGKNTTMGWCLLVIWNHALTQHWCLWPQSNEGNELHFYLILSSLPSLKWKENSSSQAQPPRAHLLPFVAALTKPVRESINWTILPCIYCHSIVLNSLHFICKSCTLCCLLLAHEFELHFSFTSFICQPLFILLSKYVSVKKQVKKPQRPPLLSSHGTTQYLLLKPPLN